jgi:hypothetical protein
VIKLQYSSLNDVATTMTAEAAKCAAQANPGDGVVISHNMLAGILSAIAKVAEETQRMDEQQVKHLGRWTR